MEYFDKIKINLIYTVRRCVVLLYSNNYSCIIITTTDITLADTKRKPAN
jgi:hypothetical protein